MVNTSECTELAANAVAGLYGKWIKDSFEGDYINTTALDTLFFSFQLSFPFRFQKDLRPLCFFNLVLPLILGTYLSLSLSLFLPPCSVSLSLLVSVSLLLSLPLFSFIYLSSFITVSIFLPPSLLQSVVLSALSLLSVSLFSLTVSPRLSCQEFMTAVIGES